MNWQLCYLLNNVFDEHFDDNEEYPGCLSAYQAQT